MRKATKGAIFGLVIMAMVIAYASSLDATSFAAVSAIAVNTVTGPVYTSLDEAQGYNTLYVTQNVDYIDDANRIKAFAVNIEQLNAMNQLMEENPGLSGFRIYMGSASTGAVNTVVGVDSNGEDVLETGIYLTESAGSGPCPYVCDVSSPLNILSD